MADDARIDIELSAPQQRRSRIRSVLATDRKAIFGLAVLTMLAFVAIFAPLIIPYVPLIDYVIPA